MMKKFIISMAKERIQLFYNRINHFRHAPATTLMDILKYLEIILKQVDLAQFRFISITLKFKKAYLIIKLSRLIHLIRNN